MVRAHALWQQEVQRLRALLLWTRKLFFGSVRRNHHSNYPSSWDQRQDSVVTEFVFNGTEAVAFGTHSSRVLEGPGFVNIRTF